MPLSCVFGSFCFCLFSLLFFHFKNVFLMGLRPLKIGHFYKMKKVIDMVDYEKQVKQGLFVAQLTPRSKVPTGF